METSSGKSHKSWMEGQVDGHKRNLVYTTQSRLYKMSGEGNPSKSVRVKRRMERIWVVVCVCRED